MFNLIYQTALFLLALIALPKLLWQWWMLGKYKESLRERLGISLPPSLPHAQVIWIHAVSVGETRAVIPLYETLRKHLPDAAFVISSTTETGHREAKRSMPDAAVHCFLPFDFSWIVRRFVQRLHPNILIFVESDFWYQLIDAVKKQGGKVLVVNGKVSERSCRRFCQVPFFTRRLFSQVDHFCVQSRLYLERFQKMGIPISKLTSTGNLKFDARLKTLTPAELVAWRTQLGITEQDRVLVIGSNRRPGR
jgi:3-deoxy-D-manno-octulosonic-acid transferase